MIQFAYLSLTGFELEGDLGERVAILHLVLLNPAEHIRARSHGHPMVRQVRGQQTCPSGCILVSIILLLLQKCIYLIIVLKRVRLVLI